MLFWPRFGGVKANGGAQLGFPQQQDTRTEKQYTKMAINWLATLWGALGEPVEGPKYHDRFGLPRLNS